jgi:hypothetical protein
MREFIVRPPALATGHFRFESGLFTRITPGVFADRRWNMDWRPKWRHANAQIDVNLRWAQTHVGLGTSRGKEMWGGIVFDDLWTIYANLDGRPHDMVGYRAAYSFGRNPAFDTLGLGDERTLSLALELKPVDRLIVEPTLDDVRSEDATTGDLLFRQTIARARVRLQVNPRLSLRLVVQHNDSESPLYRALAQAGDFPDYHMYFGSKWEVDPLLTCRVNPFSVFYLGSTHDYHDYDAARDGAPSNLVLTERQYFTKLQDLFQL